MSRIFVEQMGATRSDAVLIYRARNIGEDAVSTTIGKQLATIRRLFDRVDRPSMEAAKIKRGDETVLDRPRRVVIFDAPRILDSISGGSK